jgi:hypothetical protein
MNVMMKLADDDGDDDDDDDDDEEVTSLNRIPVGCQGV